MALVEGEQGTNFSNFAHYDPVQGCIVEPITTLFVDDIEEAHTGNGVQFLSNVGIESDKTLVVAGIQGPTDPSTMLPDPIDAQSSIQFDTGYGVAFGNSGNTLENYSYTTLIGNWVCAGFTQASGVFVTRIGSSINISMYGFTTTQNNATPGATQFSVVVPALYRPTTTVILNSYWINGAGVYLAAQASIGATGLLTIYVQPTAGAAILQTIPQNASAITFARFDGGYTVY